MLVKTELAQTPSVKRLVKAWSQLYTLNFQSIALTQDPSFYTKLTEAISLEGRVKTAAKLNERIIELRCEMASVKTSALYAYMQNVMHLQEVKRIADASFKIYTQLVDLYQQNLLNAAFVPAAEPLISALRPEPKPLKLAIASNIDRLSSALEPVLLEFQQEHSQLKDWRTLGFLTTQINFCNQWITDKLTPIEQVLLSPYLTFIEEQVAHPWQRVCAAAARHPADSLVLALAEQMIPMSGEIADAAYSALTRLLPNHRSRRGMLTNPGVTHSCIRDLKMFQVYLWLCVLEESLVPVEEELVRLCVMVLPSVGVQWEMTELWTQVLTDEVIRRIEPSRRKHVLPYVLPYTSGIEDAFLAARIQLDTQLSRQVAESSGDSNRSLRASLKTIPTQQSYFKAV
ncbi:MAG: hypothetical protein HC866_26665 [Leptolyngbyaceae cyanobacterium RU_5_1]|nr:hypothetical protein [Leptolyngbyaceae cyanobacterium RU_5_1]